MLKLVDVKFQELDTEREWFETYDN
jgi:hypothetical protein